MLDMTFRTIEQKVRCEISPDGYCVKPPPERLRCAAPMMVNNYCAQLASWISHRTCLSRPGDTVTMESDEESVMRLRVNGALKLEVDSGKLTLY